MREERECQAHLITGFYKNSSNESDSRGPFNRQLLEITRATIRLTARMPAPHNF